MDRDDARGPWLGKLTDCCQHLEHSIGNKCARHGQASPDGGFFVVENDDGDIIAQSWIYKTPNGGFCFDNCEALTLGNRQADVLSIYEKAAHDLCETFKYHTVTIGKGASDLDISSLNDAGNNTQALPSGYVGHTDAASQKLLEHNPAYLPNQKTTRPIIRGASEADIPAVTEVARACYPTGWQFISYEEADHGWIINAPDGQPAGYAMVNSNDREVLDLAVLPQHRLRYTKPLFDELMKHMTERGGVWTADAREETSYKMLLRCRDRKLINIIKDEVSHDRMGTSQMHHVEFSMNGPVSAAAN